MPADFSGYWKMVSNDNFEEYLKALDVNVAVRKIANLLKPDKEILQNGDHMIIKTLSTFRNYIMEFDVGKEFEEDLAGVDDRKCMTSKAYSPPGGAPFSITPQEQRIYNPKYVQYWWLEFLRKVKLRQDSFLSRSINFSCASSVFLITLSTNRINHCFLLKFPTELYAFNLRSINLRFKHDQVVSMQNLSLLMMN
ncbi:retinol-binding protein 1 isoform X1 [Haliaeetus albicilla]|uniref:retinol-binding protein 1 isoform X1 n=1 Tax=Haliaeetus albicilla TaxID=8969 RepID=UPI0037E74F87